MDEEQNIPEEKFEKENVSAKGLPHLQKYSFTSPHYATLCLIGFASFSYASAPFAHLISYSCRS